MAWSELTSLFDPQCGFLVWNPVHDLIDRAKMGILRVRHLHTFPLSSPL